MSVSQANGTSKQWAIPLIQNPLWCVRNLRKTLLPVNAWLTHLNPPGEISWLCNCITLQPCSQACLFHFWSTWGEWMCIPDLASTIIFVVAKENSSYPWRLSTWCKKQWFFLKGGFSEMKLNSRWLFPVNQVNNRELEKSVKRAWNWNQ